MRKHDFKCDLEVFSPRLSSLFDLARQYADLGFTLSVMAWPVGPSPAGFGQWLKDVKDLSRCENVCVDISTIDASSGWPGAKRRWHPGCCR